MDNLIEFQRFPDFNAASELIDILEANQIPYQVDDSATRFDIASASTNPMENQIIVRIRETHFETVNNLFEKKTSQTDENNDVDHYLYTFSDNDIIDVIANPEEWTETEVKIANEIFKQRGLKPTAELIKSVRKEKIQEQNKKVTETRNRFVLGYSWFLWIAILSIINSIDFAFHNKMFFICGLGMVQLVDEIMNMAEGHFVIFGLIINILLPTVFIIFWYYAKKRKRWAFITGMLVYALDTIIFILIRDWWSVGFHVFVIGLISGGYDSLKKKNETLVT
jgi:hypothetical protein